MAKLKSWILAIFIIGLTAFSVLLIEDQRENRRLYLKEETMLRHLKKEPFLTKAAAPWMLEQIEKDFQDISSISKEAVEEAFNAVKRFSPMVVRYRIVNNELYRYFPDKDPISLDDNNTERAIKTISQRTQLPNMDFVVSYFDNYPFSSNELKTPIFVSAKLKNTLSGILIPDWRSIGHWWMSDIKAVRKARIPWEKKRPFALWRGGLTKSIRHALCKLSLKHPSLLDARISADPGSELRQKFEEEGVMGNRVSWKEFLECKYLPYVDGVMCAAPALQWRLLSGSLTFKPDSDETQWFYGALKPYIHYVPVKNDLSDLIEKIEWAIVHNEEVKIIAEQACRFAEENLRYSDVLNYFSFVLKRYGSCQKLHSKDLKKEMQDNPRWVKIQFRKPLREIAGKCGMVGYCSEGTPLAL